MAMSKSSFACHYFIFFLVATVNANNNDSAAIFIFGDSTFDVGTNDFLNGTTALANFPYNGIDFPGQVATGRFSNGYNLADKLAIYFGQEKSPLPYLYLANNISLFKEEIFKGVNFASGGAGILDKTGSKLWHRVVSLKDQIQQFALVCGNMTDMKGSKETAKILGNSLFLFSVGANDILDPLRLGINITKGDLIASLRAGYYHHLKNLYHMGARKYGVISSAPVGCCPYARSLNKTGGCLRTPNEYAKTFYHILHSILQNMASKYPEMKYSLGDTYNMTSFLFKNYKNFGFKELKTACCGTGYFNAEGACNKTQNPNLCENRGEYVFWDLYHPSEAATNLTALTLFYGGLNFVKPINFSQLQKL